jgi:hypothetical protein
VHNIFGSRIFFPQWGTFRVFQKGHYGLRENKRKKKKNFSKEMREVADPETYSATYGNIQAH